MPEQTIPALIYSGIFTGNNLNGQLHEMKVPKNLNHYLILLIIGLAAIWVSFEYGYSLGERKGYVMGVNKCLDEIQGAREKISSPTNEEKQKSPG